jgi:hypothetical protein
MHANQVIVTCCKTSFICSRTASDVLIGRSFGPFRFVRARNVFPRRSLMWAIVCTSNYWKRSTGSSLSTSWSTLETLLLYVVTSWDVFVWWWYAFLCFISSRDVFLGKHSTQAISCNWKFWKRRAGSSLSTSWSTLETLLLYVVTSWDVFVWWWYAFLCFISSCDVFLDKYPMQAISCIWKFWKRSTGGSPLSPHPRHSNRNALSVRIELFCPRVSWSFQVVFWCTSSRKRVWWRN